MLSHVRRLIARLPLPGLPVMTWQRRGGLHFWRFGRLGGSFYLAAESARVPAALLSDEAVMVTRFSDLPSPNRVQWREPNTARGTSDACYNSTVWGDSPVDLRSL